MVKTRHGDELSPHNVPQFLSLNREKQHRYSRKSADDADDSLVKSRAYTEGSNAFNIFEEKVVDSRLRPRTGPSRAYNYLDADSSDEESRYRSRRLSGRRTFSPPHQDEGSTHRLRQRQVKAEILEDEEIQERRRSRNSLRRRRELSPEDRSDHDTDAFEEGIQSSHHTVHSSLKVDQDSASESLSRRSLRRACMQEIDESDQEPYLRRRVGSQRLRQKKENEESSDEDEEHEGKQSSVTRTFKRKRTNEEGEVEAEREEEEGGQVRRSSRKRRQAFDTLNQSYLVSIPGQKKEDTAVDEDSKDEDSDNNEYSDMYSRVKRKRIHVKRNMYGVPINEDSDSDDDKEENKNNNNDDQEEEEDDEDDDDVDDDDNEEEEDEGKDVNQSRRVLRNRRTLKRTQPQQTVKSYSLRQHKPKIDRYKPPEEKRRVRKADHSVFASTPTKASCKKSYQSPARKRHLKKRSAFHSSSSSTSSSDSESSDEKNFKRRKAKSMAKARNRMMPMNINPDALASSSVLKDRVKSGVSLADVEPMNIDKNVTFDSIGGLGKHIRKLKEMVVFPLLYDNVFQRFKVDPPRGVLFYGPPGTGKTLVARALANECSQGDRRVAFFMRKGADCLSKWVGESERQLRLLFDQAYKFRPSIIFFDEIDGLAPVRSSRQDQIHSSIVSTLLALMDGLDSRGEIVVIGATNRIDSLDPALRRPGRFDREFLFPLPSVEARKQILKIHTNSWNPRLNDIFLAELAEKCVGYCGADLKALCTEAAMQALRRRYPQIYLTNEALQLDVSSINVSAKDFFNAIASIIPTSQRSVNTPARALAPRVAPLLQPQLNSVMDKLGDIFPASLAEGGLPTSTGNLSQAKQLAEKGIPWDELLSDEDECAPSIFVSSTQTKGNKLLKTASVEEEASSSPAVSNFLNFTSYATCLPTTFRPRLMLVGTEGQGQTTHLAPAVIHRMENLPVHVLDLPTLYAVTAKTPEESCANVFHEAKRKVPSILYLPYMDQWWDVMADTLRATLLTLIQDLDPALPLLLLATSERPYQMLDPTLRSLFSTHSCEVSVMRNPGKEERQSFFQDLLLRQTFKPPPQKKQAAQRVLEPLPLASAPKPKDLSPEELALLVEKEELTLMELRIFLRDVLNKLGTDKKFSIFAKPVNIEDAADYYDIIETPMDLSSMMAKIDLHEYSTVRHFLNDIDLICSNALEYNPDRGPMDRVIRHRACALKDTAYAIIKTELDKEFEKTCVEIQESRKRRGEKSGTVPNFYNTKLKHNNASSRVQVATDNAKTADYLDKPQIQRTIPKPDGERYSRRVRGLNSDPVPPLEVVEKVYKSTREEKNNSNNAQSDGDEEELKPEFNAVETKEGVGNNAATQDSGEVQILTESKEKTLKEDLNPSAGKKKTKAACVWCRPKRRKRRRLNLFKPGEKLASADQSLEGENEEEDEEEMSAEEEQGRDVDEVLPTGKQDVSQQLAVDVELEAKCGKGRQSRSPASAILSAPGGVSTRRSSMSPRLAVVSPAAALSPSSRSTAASNSTLGEKKPDQEAEIKEQSKVSKVTGTEEANLEKAKALLAHVRASGTDLKSAVHHNSQDVKEVSESSNRPRAVKRLDMDLVITDSGHCSSLDSNGDSRDSLDHKTARPPSCHISTAIQDIEALVNSNHNCSEDIRSTATAILQTPKPDVVADVPRATRLLSRLVSRTEGHTVERLEKIYSHISQLIYRYRHNPNKTALMEAMEMKVEDLTAKTLLPSQQQRL